MATECANPLFARWLKEKLDVADERSSKGRTTYKKAYDSMVACPIAFTHPSEALQLHGLGPKLCDHLLERLKTHNLEHGLPPPALPQKGRKRGGNDSDGESPEPAKKARKPKTYVPQLRSGPYALIKALSSLDKGASLTKAHLIDEAQQYCDSSFTVPSNPNKFYTAWNSMKTLIDKDLVDERGRPTRKYNLTDEGWKVAKGINRSESSGGGHVELDLGQVDEPEFPNPKKSKASNAGAKKTKEPQSSAVHCSKSPEIRPVARRKYHFDLDSSSPASEPILKKNPLQQHTDAAFGNENDKFGVRAARTARGLDKPTSPRDVFELSSSPGVLEPISHNISSPPVSRRLSIPKESQWRPLNPLTNDLSNGIYNTTRDEREPLAQNNKPLNADKSQIPDFRPIILPAGAFTVKLVLDCREVRAKSDREYIQEELAGRGAKPLLRSLELGDAFWVAEVHDPDFLRNHGEEGTEVVLDWIVERKRLDDLVGSIKDGRFREQKFRLAKSGIENVIYVIEDFNLGPETASKYGEAINSAIASTQVVNGFFVKQTLKLDDTIRYLARMTHLLRSIYEGKPLVILPSHTLTPSTYLPLLTRLRKEQSQTSYHLTYSTFSSLSSKSETLSLRDVFLKMLMCTHGITGEKALAIQRVWKTPREFVAAFGKCSTEEEKRRMLEGKVGGPVRTRKIGRALSAKVAEVWGDL